MVKRQYTITFTCCDCCNKSDDRTVPKNHQTSFDNLPDWCKDHQIDLCDKCQDDGFEIWHKDDIDEPQDRDEPPSKWGIVKYDVSKDKVIFVKWI